MKNIVVIYHKDCPDGFGAAWAAWRKFGNRAEYIPATYEMPPLKGLTNKEIYILDFSYPVSVIKQLVKNNRNVTVIDHHLTARKNAEAASQWYYDLNHSGAVLTWLYFYQTKKIPWFLLRIEDIDLWRLRLKDSLATAAFLKVEGYDLRVWDKIAEGFEKSKTRKKYIEAGKMVLKYQEKIVEALVSSADLVKFAGHRTLVVNSPILPSQIGNALVKKMPPIGIVWSEKGGVKKISLRSNGRVDVSKIAKRFGGGGHKQAAGFYLKSKMKFPWKSIKNA